VWLTETENGNYLTNTQLATSLPIMSGMNLGSPVSEEDNPSLTLLLEQAAENNKLDDIRTILESTRTRGALDSNFLQAGLHKSTAI
jgi:spore germination protein YaaH